MKKHYLEEDEITSKKQRTISCQATDLVLLFETSLNGCFSHLNTRMTTTVILKKDKVSGLIYWPGTSFIVKSLTEPIVIASAVFDEENKNTKIIPLTDEDLETCSKLNIPSKYTDISFQGQSRLPKSMLKNELNKWN
jgi:hypothetical protein